MSCTSLTPLELRPLRLYTTHLHVRQVIRAHLYIHPCQFLFLLMAVCA